jgi:aminoglycoside 6'-N-acetyltransferase
LQRTWDGIEIASDPPTGSSVVVRRRRSHRVEVLLLHRAVHGAAFHGDWAWTAPAGCRQPGEAVYPAALRELAEEAGLTGLSPWAVDLSGPWAVFAVDLDPDRAIELVDPEHDRYVWVEASEVGRRVLPAFVGAQQLRAAQARVTTVALRPMDSTDLDLVVRWRHSTHVRTWWDEPGSADEVRAHYLPRLGGDDPTRLWVAEIDGRPAGFVQAYRVGAHDEDVATTSQPDAVGIDYLIGEPELCGQGSGTRVIWEFVRDVVAVEYPGARYVLASPSRRNAASLRVLAKCGFRQGLWIDAPARPGEVPDTEIVCTLDLAHWIG